MPGPTFKRSCEHDTQRQLHLFPGDQESQRPEVRARAGAGQQDREAPGRVDQHDGSKSRSEEQPGETINFELL